MLCCASLQVEALRGGAPGLQPSAETYAAIERVAAQQLAATEAVAVSEREARHFTASRFEAISGRIDELVRRLSDVAASREAAMVPVAATPSASEVRLEAQWVQALQRLQSQSAAQQQQQLALDALRREVAAARAPNADVGAIASVQQQLKEVSGRLLTPAQVQMLQDLDHDRRNTRIKVEAALVERMRVLEGVLEQVNSQLRDVRKATDAAQRLESKVLSTEKDLGVLTEHSAAVHRSVEARLELLVTNLRRLDESRDGAVYAPRRASIGASAAAAAANPPKEAASAMLPSPTPMPPVEIPGWEPSVRPAKHAGSVAGGRETQQQNRRSDPRGSADEPLWNSVARWFTAPAKTQPRPASVGQRQASQSTPSARGPTAVSKALPAAAKRGQPAGRAQSLVQPPTAAVPNLLLLSNFDGLDSRSAGDIDDGWA